MTIILSPDTPKSTENNDKSNESNTKKKDTKSDKSNTKEKNKNTIKIKLQSPNNKINNNDKGPSVKTTMDRLVPQSMRRYISSKSEKELYDLLSKIISEESCWKNIDDNDLKKMKAPEDPTYLELAGKTFDELSYSNLIAYYLKYSPKGFYEFFKEFFADSDDSAFAADNTEENEHSKISYSVTRERYINCDSDKGSKSLRGRADIWIEGRYKNKKFLILIENKIKSGIKGTSDENVTQLDLYKQAIEKELKNSPNLLYCLVLLVPDYYESTHPEFKKDENPYSENPHSYKVIRYSELFGFFERNSTEYKEAPYFKDFKRCLKRQTESEGQATYSIMKERFIHRIIQVSEKNRTK